MNPNESQQELLLRYLEDRVTPEERQQVVASLRTDAAARAFLRTVSEQAVTSGSKATPAAILGGVMNEVINL